MTKSSHSKQIQGRSSIFLNQNLKCFLWTKKNFKKTNKQNKLSILSRKLKIMQFINNYNCRSPEDYYRTSYRNIPHLGCIGMGWHRHPRGFKVNVEWFVSEKICSRLIWSWVWSLLSFFRKDLNMTSMQKFQDWMSI